MIHMNRPLSLFTVQPAYNFIFIALSIFGSIGFVHTLFSVFYVNTQLNKHNLKFLVISIHTTNHLKKHLMGDILCLL